MGIWAFPPLPRSSTPLLLFFPRFSLVITMLNSPPSPHFFHRLGSFLSTSPQHPLNSLSSPTAKSFPSIFLPHPAQGRAVSRHPALSWRWLFPVPWLCPEDAAAIPAWSLPCPAVTVPFVSPSPGASPPHGPVPTPARVLYSPWPFPVPPVHLNHPADSGGLSDTASFRHFIPFFFRCCNSVLSGKKKKKNPTKDFQNKATYCRHGSLIFSWPEGCGRRKRRELDLELVQNPGGIFA